MIVIIEKDIFNNPIHFNDLDKLFYIFEDDLHIWDLENPEFIKNSMWVKENPNSRISLQIQEFIEKLSLKSSWQITSEKRRRKSTLTISNNSDFKDILKFLNFVSVIIVENFDSDYNFINRILKLYKNNEILKALREHWLRIEGVGGVTEVPKKIEHYFNSFTDKNLTKKIFVLVDGDFEFKGDTYDKTRFDIITKCKQYNVRFHILYKKAIENYLPDNILKENVSEELFKVYARFNNEQKDFFNMKKGFNNNKVSDKQKTLFSNLTNPEIKTLNRGFINDKLHLLFNSDEIQLREIEKRCSHHDSNELKKIIDEIEKIL